MSRKSDRVEGLTTAASVWATAGVGAATGYGLYLLATGTTVLLLFVLHRLVHLDVSSDAIEERSGGGGSSGNAAGVGHGGPGRRDE